jgi:hypothetical protein
VWDEWETLGGTEIMKVIVAKDNELKYYWSDETDYD